jgi:hypothetical protein
LARKGVLIYRVNESPLLLQVGKIVYLIRNPRISRFPTCSSPASKSALLTFIVFFREHNVPVPWIIYMCIGPLASYCCCCSVPNREHDKPIGTTIVKFDCHGKLCPVLRRQLNNIIALLLSTWRPWWLARATVKLDRSDGA